jgi:hypothetical protein
LGLFGVTVYYGVFVVNRSSAVVKRYNAAKAAQEAELKAQQEPSQ